MIEQELTLIFQQATKRAFPTWENPAARVIASRQADADYQWNEALSIAAQVGIPGPQVAEAIITALGGTR